MANIALVDDEPKPSGGKPTGSYENPSNSKNSQTLDCVLKAMGYDFRWNLRAKRTEYREAVVSSDPTQWEYANDRVFADLRQIIARQFWVNGAKEKPVPLNYGRELWSDCLNAILRYHEVDPFKEWLEYYLPDWDGENRLDPMLAKLFHADPDELSAWAGRYLCLGCVQRTYEPGCQLDEIPVLIGPQGIGKTSLLTSLVPPEMPNLYTPGLRWDTWPERQVEATRQRAIVEVSEMAGRSRAEVEHIKAFVTTRDDGAIRLPYARTPEPMPRRFIIVATTNNKHDLPNDPSGNRRFVPIVLSKGSNIEEWMRIVRNQLWAEALHEYRSGKRANLPRVLHNAAALRAEEHRERDDIIEDAVLRLPSDKKFTMTEIVERLPENLQALTQHRIGKALKNAGWESNRVRIDGKLTRLWECSTVPLVPLCPT